jgi:hypothetical protein
MSLRTFATQRPVLSAVACAALQFLLTIAILQAGKPSFRTRPSAR